MAYVRKEDPLILRKYERVPRCVFCGRYEGRIFRDHLVCEDCLDYIKTMFPDAK